MSIKTTYSITRELAIETIQEKINNCTDEQIENILEEVVHNGFYNFSIVTNGELNRETEMGYPTILTWRDIPESNNAY